MTHPSPLDSDDLDPNDWETFRRLGHAALDDMISFVRDVRKRPVWTEAPDDVRRRFAAPLPRGETPLEDVLAEFDRSIKPYATGNLHPAFMGWVHGAGTPVGMIAEMLAAGLNANCGGRNHIAIAVERQMTAWMREAFGFPETATGLFVTGTSMANFLGVLLARGDALGARVRRTGIAGTDRLCAYASAAAHGCIGQAMSLAGLGSDYLRPIGCNAAGEMDIGPLQDAIAADRAAGRRPFLVVASAGTVDIGAIDPLPAIHEIARRENLWFHIDGAFGALGALSADLKPLLAGLENADSIAFDFHKWGQVPYDAGFFLARDGAAHRATFAATNGYLTRADVGLAAGDLWPCDLGPDLSRGFRALKTWFTIKVYGADRLGATMAKSCRLARQLEELVVGCDTFDVVAPVKLNIVCLSARGVDADALNRRIVERLHLRGEAAPSVTILAGKAVIRCAINNHRTNEADIVGFMRVLERAYADLTV